MIIVSTIKKGSSLDKVGQLDPSLPPTKSPFKCTKRSIGGPRLENELQADPWLDPSPS